MKEQLPITRLVDFLRTNHLTIACAESCTGGRLSAALTAFAGASEFFWGSVVVYANEAKNQLAGISWELLQTAGPVSPAVTKALATRIRTISGSDYSLAITGLAGPKGDSYGNPIGRLYIGLASETKPTQCWKLELQGDRGQILAAATNEAFSLICNELDI